MPMTLTPSFPLRPPLHPPLHPAPRWRAVAREQLRAVALLLRAEGVAFGALLALGAGLTIRAAVRTAAGGGHTNVGYDPEVAVAGALLGCVAALGTWRNEGPSRRDYHWAMPVAQGTHTLTKALAGWTWLTGAVALLLVVLAGLAAVVGVITGDPQSGEPLGWTWLVPFTAATVAYLWSSAAALASDHPWRWVGGLTAAYLLAYAFADGFRLDGVRNLLDALFKGPYSLGPAVLGHVAHGGRSAEHGMADAPQWLAATLLWAALGAGAVVVAARRRGDR